MNRVKGGCENSFGALFIDLDGFKLINDKQGHAVGDKILLKVVRILKQNTRQSPFFQVSTKRKNSDGYHFIQMIFGFFRILKFDRRRIRDFVFNSFKYDWLIRFGGDEFILILKNIGSQEDLKKIAEKILSLFREEIKITASIGGSLFNKFDEVNEEKFMKKIDDAVYSAKNNGRNCVRIV
jgi:GGDEF domain-containing protein